MKITAMKFYGGSREKACRLGMADLFFELQQIVFNTQIEVEEIPQANSAAIVRESLDAEFAKHADWIKTVSGGVDWVKKLRYNSTILVRLGVEVQVSARSDLLIRDVVHLRNSLQEGVIDVGVIIVPSNQFSIYLTDRTPSISDALRLIEHEFPEATTFPILLMAIEYDRPGAKLPKKTTNRGAGKKGKPEAIALANAIGDPIPATEASEK
jgi:hypothetical protein